MVFNIDWARNVLSSRWRMAQHVSLLQMIYVTKAAEQGGQPERRLARFLYSKSVAADRLPWSLAGREDYQDERLA
jgi:hypothetical protein